MPVAPRRDERAAGSAREHASGLLLSAGIPAAIVAAAALVPRPLLLPFLGGVLASLALALAVLAQLRREPRDGPGLTTWDVAGLLAFLGSCAAVLGDPEEAVALLQQQVSPPKAH
jgi:hypothetical protein